MNKTTAIEWLNSRLELANKGQYLNFGPLDIDFIRDYIYHFKEKLKNQDEIIHGLRNRHPNDLSNIIDSMMTILVNHFNITTETKEVQVGGMEIFFNGGLQTRTMITKYS